jgi:hypothetical protein
MSSLRLAGALLSAITLVPLTGTDAADAAPVAPYPSGCASTAGYTANGNFYGKLTLCLFDKDETATDGTRYRTAAYRLTAHCSEKGSLPGVWNARRCAVMGKLTLRKDGRHIWTEDKSFTTDYVLDHYSISEGWRCRGTGEYSMTFNDITVHVYKANGGHNWEDLIIKPVTRTSSGCPTQVQ